MSGAGPNGESIWIPDLTRSVRKLPFLRRPEAELSFICVSVRWGGREEGCLDGMGRFYDPPGVLCRRRQVRSY